MYIQYNWNNRESLNLAVWPKTDLKKILAEFKFDCGAFARNKTGSVLGHVQLV